MLILNRIKKTLQDRVMEKLNAMKNIDCIKSITLTESHKTIDSIKLEIHFYQNSPEDEVISISMYVSSRVSDKELILTLSDVALEQRVKLRKDDLLLTRENMLDLTLQKLMDYHFISTSPLLQD
jgi:hypothetical protein